MPDQGGWSEIPENHEMSEIINASHATSNSNSASPWPNYHYQQTSENQNIFQANPNDNAATFERYENHIEIINQDRYDLVCDDDESTFEEILAENNDASHATTNDDTAGQKIKKKSSQKTREIK